MLLGFKTELKYCLTFRKRCVDYFPVDTLHSIGTGTIVLQVHLNKISCGI